MLVFSLCLGRVVQSDSSIGLNVKQKKEQTTGAHTVIGYIYIDYSTIRKQFSFLSLQFYSTNINHTSNNNDNGTKELSLNSLTNGLVYVYVYVIVFQCGCMHCGKW